ncbi:MAG: Gfo/Idh/MocA family oxidoreductase [Planctomycetota bacterium]|nr:Gfo/Idh/MocA family oxidoreductase [Planctomycetota bacterium]
MSNARQTNRREFIKVSAAAAAAGAWSLSAASYGRVMGSNAQLQVAYVGTGGIASNQHIPILTDLGAGCPCYCDADKDRFGPAADRFPDAPGYTDYRRMYDKHLGEIDAVMVGTPDHQHYPATIIAMMAGKHAYTQKPLTHTPWEARQLAIAAEKYKVATQMGNQGHASESLRKSIDYLRSGAIGDLKEAHIWTNRPIWRQGMAVPEGGQEVPANFDWEAWVGPAAMRPYRRDPADGWGGFYHPFNWRGFWDFGCGALGDMACHEMDPVYWALMPGLPTSVELIAPEPIGDRPMYFSNGIVKFQFAADGDRPGFDLYWYEGGDKPARPEELEEETELTAEGALYIGSKGKMIALPAARAEPRLLPAELHEATGTPPEMIERSEGHHLEWYKACTGDAPYTHPKSNFTYAGPFSESVLLGCVAQKVGGRLEYDAAAQRFTNSDVANRYISKEYRKGWDFRMA